ncbi:hypothetical protein HDU80_005255 [Chytriomyces hyalinus]|nr:hypothetical protein HDU80_005255 [Chytriomyces hyalinus]
MNSTEDVEKQSLLPPTTEKKKSCCPMAAATRGGHCKHAVLFIVGAIFIAIHHIFHHGHWSGNPHWSEHLWLEANGTVEVPPSSIVLHYTDALAEDTISLRFHKYTRASHEDHPGALNHSSHFTRCEPDSVNDGVAVFGPSCVDMVKDFNEADAGTRITYALIAFGKKKGHEHDGDHGDDNDNEDAAHEKAHWIAKENKQLFGERGDDDKRHARDGVVHHGGHGMSHDADKRPEGHDCGHHGRPGPVASRVNHRKYAVLLQTIVLHKD